jgi:hypothetical protein
MTDFTGLTFHPGLSIKKYFIGEERAPLLVVDNVVTQAEELVEWSKSLAFADTGRAFPGVRALAPPVYQKFILEKLQPLLIQEFQLHGKSLRFSMCHYSLVTTTPEKLTMVQKIPHVDSFDMSGLASVHYLFRENLGGTAFYRHRKTGFEYIDESRKLLYFKSLEAENEGNI